MILISHRGNINGVNKQTENNPSHITEVLKHYNVEADIWHDQRGFFLGHDDPEYIVIDFCSCKMKDLFPERLDMITAFEIMEHLYPEDIATFLENCSYIGDYLFASLHHCGEDSSTFDLTNHNTVRQYDWWEPILKEYGEIIFKADGKEHMSGMDGSTLVIIKLFDNLTDGANKRSLKTTIEIPLENDYIHKIDIKHLIDGVDTTRWKAGWDCFLQASGQHYKLLAHISKYIEGNIIDIGTLAGASAIALSYNIDNTVYTFDLPVTTFYNWSQKDKQEVYNDDFRYADNKRSNIVQKVGNVLKSSKILLSSDLIFLDIDHSGVIERKIVEYLINKKWEGILIMDDTHDPVMEEIIKLTENYASTYDLTGIGHNTGTVAMIFGSKYTFVEIKK